MKEADHSLSCPEAEHKYCQKENRQAETETFLAKLVDIENKLTVRGDKYQKLKLKKDNKQIINILNFEKCKASFAIGGTYLFTIKEKNKLVN